MTTQQKHPIPTETQRRLIRSLLMDVDRLQRLDSDLRIQLRFLDRCVNDLAKECGLTEIDLFTLAQEVTR